ncbi:MAG: hypothetical protein ACXQTW_00800 [Candidatus Methanospirareceae archaeon]
MSKAEISLEVVKDALTEERAQEYRDRYDDGWEKEGYLITGDLQIEEIYVENILESSCIIIRAYNGQLPLPDGWGL